MSHAVPPADKPVTVPDFLSARTRGVRLTVLTCYDYTFARLLDAAGVDALLVGDSVGMVVHGHENSLKVTLDHIVEHSRWVAKGARRALVIADLPFMTYQVSPQQAVENAGRLIQQGDAKAVKLEGGVRTAAAIRAVTNADIAVMGHVGLTPQSVHRLGGFRVQRDANKLIEDAKAVEEAGAFAVVVECVPADIGQRITEAVKIPTIGIGAGPHCDGQVLVLHDLLGITTDLRPKFAKRYAELGTAVSQAVRGYCDEVRAGTFPAAEHSFR